MADTPPSSSAWRVDKTVRQPKLVPILPKLPNGITPNEMEAFIALDPILIRPMDTSNASSKSVNALLRSRKSVDSTETNPYLAGTLCIGCNIEMKKIGRASYNLRRSVITARNKSHVTEDLVRQTLDLDLDDTVFDKCKVCSMCKLYLVRLQKEKEKRDEFRSNFENLLSEMESTGRLKKCIKKSLNKPGTGLNLANESVGKVENTPIVLVDISPNEARECVSIMLYIFMKCVYVSLIVQYCM